MRLLKWCCIGLLIGFYSVASRAGEDVRPAPLLHGVFTSNMVLQRGKPIVFSGTAAAGAEVKAVFAGNEVTAMADKGGEWRAEFPAMAADGKGYTLTVTCGAETRTLENILIGDVWVCSGQSNMEMPVGGSNPFYRVGNYEAEIAAANHPQIRLYNTNPYKYPSPGFLQNEPRGKGWEVCSADSVVRFSACGYLFGRDMHQYLNIPIGIINCSWGGTNIETWISRDAYAANHRPEDEVIGQMVERLGKAVNRDEQMKMYIADCLQWQERVMNSGAPETVAAARAWKKADFDDSAWRELSVPAMMPEDFDGVAWFRQTVEIPENLAGKDLVLRLGTIDDIDETFFNGEAVGGINMARKNFWKTPRVYNIPASLVKAGKNVIAIRVADVGGDGGLTSAAREMRLESKDNPRQAVFLKPVWKWNVEFPVDLRKFPARPMLADSPNFPASLYNSLVNPWTRVAIAGVIWYQGCSNTGRPGDYYALLKMLVNDWRAKWKNPEMPFLAVQLAAFEKHQPKNRLSDDFWKSMKPGDGGYPRVREAQAEAYRTIPGFGLAVAIDRGDHSDIHPRDKQTLAKRLLAEYRRIVEKKDTASPGPVYKEMKIEGGKIRIVFANTGSGLVTTDGREPLAFAVAGADGKFVWARTRLEGNDIIVWADAVKEPKNVRYAWANFPGDLNLYNKEGFPAVPFRTDRKNLSGRSTE